jgi:hypothetical protein
LQIDDCGLKETEVTSYRFTGCRRNWFCRNLKMYIEAVFFNHLWSITIVVPIKEGALP